MGIACIKYLIGFMNVSKPYMVVVMVYKHIQCMDSLYKGVEFRKKNWLTVCVGTWFEFDIFYIITTNSFKENAVSGTCAVNLVHTMQVVDRIM